MRRLLPALLAVSPTITHFTEPTNPVVFYQSRVNLEVTAAAAGAASGLNYQWRFNGADLRGANTSSYSFIADAGSAGMYSVNVANELGSTNVAWQVTLDYGTLAYHLSTNAVARTNGFSGSYLDTLEFKATYKGDYQGGNFPLLTNAVWSTNFWLKGVQGLSATCVGYSNSWAGGGLVTMISPRHYLFASHTHPESLRAAFLDTNNTLHWRTSVGIVGLGNDTAVGMLNADLPPTVGFLPVAPANLPSYLPPANSVFIQGIGMNQSFCLFSQPMVIGDAPYVRWHHAGEIPFGLGTNWAVAIRGGDSSNPERLLIHNQFVLVSHNSTVTGGPNYAAALEAINRAMHELSTKYHSGTDYQLTVFPLTNWPVIGR